MMRLLAIATSVSVLIASAGCGSSSTGSSRTGSGGNGASDKGSSGSSGNHGGAAGAGSLTILGGSGSRASSSSAGGAKSSSGGTNGGGGASGNADASGGAGASGSGAECGPFMACGGDVVGVWNVTAVCLQNPESILSSQLNAPECMNAVRNVKVNASGSYTFRADGSATTDVSESVSFTLVLDASCAGAIAGQTVSINAQTCASLQNGYQSDGSFATASCSFSQGTCLCDLTTPEDSISGGGMYQVNGTLLSDSSSDAPFCVDGDVLRISSTESGLSGTIVLKRQ